MKQAGHIWNQFFHKVFWYLTNFTNCACSFLCMGLFSLFAMYTFYSFLLMTCPWSTSLWTVPHCATSSIMLSYCSLLSHSPLLLQAIVLVTHCLHYSIVPLEYIVRYAELLLAQTWLLVSYGNRTNRARSPSLYLSVSCSSPLTSSIQNASDFSWQYIEYYTTQGTKPAANSSSIVKWMLWGEYHKTLLRH